MYKIRQSFYISKEQLKEELSSPRVWMGYLLGIAIVIISTAKLLEYAGGNNIQIFESFILSLNNRSTVTTLLLGYLIIISNAPFVNMRTLYTVVRVDKRTWGRGMILYLILQTFLYYVVLLVVSMLVSASKSFLGNLWSEPVYILAKFSPISAVENYGLLIQNSALVTEWSPLSALVNTFFLVFLYALILSMILFVLNINFNKIWGSLVALGVHFIGLLIASDSAMIPIKYSLFAHSILIWHDTDSNAPTIVSSYIVFIIILYILCEVLIRLLCYADFRSSIGDKNN